MVLTVGIGLIQLFDHIPASYRVLQTVSLLYLLFLAWKVATAAAPESNTRDDGSTATQQPLSFIQAALFQWVNPKALAMALTAITAYTPPTHPLPSVLLVAAVFGAVNFPCIGVWVVLGTHVRRLLSNRFKLRLFNGCAALLLLGSLFPILFL